MRPGESVSDKDLVLQWGFHNQDLKVTHAGKVLFNSVTGFVDSDLSPRQVSWIQDHYQKARMNYSF
jgi:hypothetical protein